MEATPEDEQYIEFIMGKSVECYWQFDQNGRRIGMVPGWEKAEAEYKRIQGIREKSENGLKVSRVTCSIE
jgi:hypothetical protein